MLILAISTVMFIYQVSEAIQKLMDPPVVDSTERLKITDIEPLLITICPLKQWNYTKLRQYGYLGQDYLLLRNFSWGAQFNLTFEELVGKVTNFNLSNTRFFGETNNGQINKKLDYKYEIRFYPKYGFCFDLVNLTTIGHLEIVHDHEYEEARVGITDKKLRTRNTVYAESHWGSKITLKQGWFHEFIVKVEQLSNFDPRNPDDCKEYVNDDYEKCIDDELQKVWKPLINCNPPWVSSKDQCDSVINITQETADSVWKKTVENIEGINDMYINPATVSCTKSCTVSQANIFYGKEEPKLHRLRSNLQLYFADQVVYTTKKLAYGPSEFLIDMGSSLGLWFGLSVFGIADLCIMAFQWVQNVKQQVMRKFMN